MPKIPIDPPILGGLADSKYYGVAGSMHELVGIDLHSKPGVMRAQYKMLKESGTTVDAPVHVILPCSDGNTYLFSSTTGKVWKRTSAGVYSLVYTTVPGAGAGDAGCKGAFEYNGYIYYATQSRLHRTLVSNPFAAVDLNWATFTATDSAYHPMVILNNVLYIGDGRYVAQVDNVTFLATALDLKTPFRITSLGTYYTDLLIGTYIADNVNRSTLYRWNTWSTSWSSEDTIEEIGIWAFLRIDNLTVAACGYSGNLYAYDGNQLQPIKNIPGEYTQTARAMVNTYAVANIHGIPVFGFSQVEGNPAKFGIYSYGGKNPSFPRILNFDYPIIPSSAIVTTNLKVYSLAVVGITLLAAWYDGTNYGVSKLDYTARCPGAYATTRVVNVNREKISSIKKIIADFETCPASCSIAVSYSYNHGDFSDGTDTVKDATRKQFYVNKTLQCNTMQAKIAFTSSGANTVEVEDINIMTE